MSLNLPDAERGCLLLADITGYTSYLQETELQHAQDVLADLLETIVQALEPTFTLSKLEGDAAFAYSASRSLHPSMILDTVELAYFAFRRRLRDVTHATTCNCNACVLIPDLDLKFFVHEGEYVVRRIARTEELTGPDVILIHRLLKGTAGEAIGKRAFAAYTKSTFDQMGMDASVLGFQPHVEKLDDVGDVEVFVQDLENRWAFEKERHRLFVTADQAKLVTTFEFEAPPPVVWEVLTNPAKRAQWQSGVSSLSTVTDGRLGQGSINHCMHGEDQIVEHVSDWRPYSYFTVSYELDDDDGFWPWTFEFEPIPNGTRVHWRMADLGDDRMGFFEQWKADWEKHAVDDVPLLLEAVKREAALTPASV